MHLSERIKSTAGCVTKGHVVADIGCDHAYTSIYLINEGIAKRIIATDINKGPVQRAVTNIRECGLCNLIEVRCSDGISDIDISDGIETILISGMGGNLMIDILKGNSRVCECVKELVIQPQSDIARVRHYLHDTGFCIVYEKMVHEDGKYYTIIKAHRGVEHYDNEYEYMYGHYLINNPDGTCIDYMRGIHESNERIIRHLIGRGGESSMKRIEELKNDNAVIEMIVKKMQKEEGI